MPSSCCSGRVGLGLLDDEPALGAHRHDHRVLHHLGLDQAEHLGAVVLGPVAPPQPAAGDRPAAQVDTFHPRRAHEDLVLRDAASGRSGTMLGSNLNAMVGRPWYALVRTVASMRCRNVRQMRSSSSDGTAVERRRPPLRGRSATAAARCLRSSAIGVELRGEHLHEQPRQRRQPRQRLLDVPLAEREAWSAARTSRTTAARRSVRW